jgi:hypothetical protein
MRHRVARGGDREGVVRQIMMFVVLGLYVSEAGAETPVVVVDPCADEHRGAEDSIRTAAAAGPDEADVARAAAVQAAQQLHECRLSQEKRAAETRAEQIKKCAEDMRLFQAMQKPAIDARRDPNTPETRAIAATFGECSRVQDEDKKLKFRAQRHPPKPFSAEDAVAAGIEKQRAWLAAKETKEKERLAAAEAERQKAALVQAHNDQLDKVLAQPGVRGLILSAARCHFERERAATLAEIAKAKKYSHVGGVVNLTEMSGLQDDLREEDDHLRGNAKRIKSLMHGPALSCSSPKIVQLLKCESQDHGGAGDPCGNDPLNSISELVGNEEDAAMEAP